MKTPSPEESNPGRTSNPAAPARWNGPGAGTRYRDLRFRGSRAAGRDLRLVERLLQRWSPDSVQRVLDAPCGAGRLSDLLGAGCSRVASMDQSMEMLQAAGPGTTRFQGNAMELPLRTGSVDVVVCCRLFHHLVDDDQRSKLLRELTRVAASTVLLSFWDATSWHALRRRTGLRRGRHPDSRVACTRGHLEALVRDVDARVLGYAASFRFLSPQTFCALEVPSGVSR